MLLLSLKVNLRSLPKGSRPFGRANRMRARQRIIASTRERRVVDPPGPSYDEADSWRRVTMARKMRLGVNIDHVATVRNARGGVVPDPVRAAQMALAAGADGITAHLREDRRHIVDEDMRRSSATVEAAQFRDGGDRADARHRAAHQAARLLPGAGKAHGAHHRGRARRGRRHEHLTPFVDELSRAGVRVSLFIEPSTEALEAAAELRAPVVELHTGAWCHAAGAGRDGKARAPNSSGCAPAAARVRTTRARMPCRPWPRFRHAADRSPPCRRSSS